MEAAKGDDAMLAGVVHGGGGDGEMGVRPGAHATVDLGALCCRGRRAAGLR